MRERIIAETFRSCQSTTFHIFYILSFLLNKKTAAKHNTRKQSNVTMWSIKKLH